MTFQYGATLRTNQVAQIQTTVGASGSLKIFSAARNRRIARRLTRPACLPPSLSRRRS